PVHVQVIRFPHYEGNAIIEMGESWDDLIKKVAPIQDNFAPDLDDIWTIKFTSGTTGTPKGVMHIHRSPSLMMKHEKEKAWLGLFQMSEHRFFSFLPLNHVAERLALEVPAIWMGGSLSFGESLDAFAKNLQDTQPTLFFAVPRIWTKFYLGILAKIPKQKLDFYLKVPILASLIKKKIRSRLGMGEVKLAATGAAITPAYLKDFYKKLGIELVEVYGMTETCGLMAGNSDLDAPPDSVGKVIPFGEIKIHPDSGEILIKTPYIMKGYYKNPEKTAEVLKDGWMHTGDQGSLDNQGFLRVTGRVKDAFKTAKGSFVSPNPLEEILIKNDYVEQVCVAGLGIPQPIALMNLSEIGLKSHPEKVAQSILESIQLVNRQGANYEKISTGILL
ncbi:MAG: AMP-binding protein, partial [Bacteroidota bacterium]